MQSHALAEEIQSLARQGRDLTSALLRRLQEAEARKMHLDLGYPTIFKFCQHVLRFSESEAQTRLEAMRLFRELPEFLQKMEKGELSLTVAALAHGCIVRHKIEDIERKRALANELCGISVNAARKRIAELYPEEKPGEKARPVSGEYTEISFPANQALMEKFERLKDLWAHKNHSRSYEKLFEEMADRCLAEEERLQRKASRTTKKRCARMSRHIPQEIRREIWRRDEGKCQYRDRVTRQPCESRHGVQIDHIKPYALGGTHDPGNLRLLCGAHNRHKGSG